MKLSSLLTLLGLLAAPVATLAQAPCPALLDHEFVRLPAGKPENLCQYRGKVVLVVNTASRCGFTPQFEGLQKLHRQYQAKGLVVLGFPSNDFNQEPDQGNDITNFCKLNYSVDFPMFEKSSVTGAKANTFHQALARATGVSPRWNFHKYLIARDGKTVVPLESRVDPDSREMRVKIEAMLAERG